MWIQNENKQTKPKQKKKGIHLKVIGSIISKNANKEIT